MLVFLALPLAVELERLKPVLRRGVVGREVCEEPRELNLPGVVGRELPRGVARPEDDEEYRRSLSRVLAVRLR